jgi:hypothetical protein
MKARSEDLLINRMLEETYHGTPESDEGKSHGDLLNYFLDKDPSHEGALSSFLQSHRLENYSVSHDVFKRCFRVKGIEVPDNWSVFSRLKSSRSFFWLDQKEDTDMIIEIILQKKGHEIAFVPTSKNQFCLVLIPEARALFTRHWLERYSKGLATQQVQSAA